MAEALRVITCTPDELRQLVQDAVDTAMKRHGSGSANDNDRLLEIGEVAKLLGVCTKSVSKYVRKDGLPARKVGAHYKFRREDVLAWSETKAVTAGAHVTKHVERVRKLR